MGTHDYPKFKGYDEAMEYRLERRKRFRRAKNLKRKYRKTEKITGALEKQFDIVSVKE